MGISVTVEISAEEAEPLLQAWRSQIQKLQSKVDTLEQQLGRKEVRAIAPPISAPGGAAPRPSKNLERVRAYMEAHRRGGVTAVGLALGMPKTSVSSVFRNNPEIFTKDGQDWVLISNEPT